MLPRKVVNVPRTKGDIDGMKTNFYVISEMQLAIGCKLLRNPERRTRNLTSSAHVSPWKTSSTKDIVSLPEWEIMP